MANKTVPLYRPGQDMTGYCTTDVQAERLAFFASPAEGVDHPIQVRATRAGDGDIPAGVVGFATKAGTTTHIAASGVQPIEAATEVTQGRPAYATSDGRISGEAGAEGANVQVGVFTAPAQEGARAFVKLNLS